jgi:DMSO/TMAO reductase YedYZ molybdopterin-dependent catalytic subunit
MRWRAAAFGLALTVAPAAWAEDLVLAGPASAPHSLAAAELATLPGVDVTVAFQTGHGPERATYRGAPLWAVLDHAGLIPPGEPKTRVRHVLLATGHDGYVAALALAEIDPMFEDKEVILATAKDGKPLPQGEIRLIVPGDKHGARAVHDVARIELQ